MNQQLPFRCLSAPRAAHSAGPARRRWVRGWMLGLGLTGMSGAQTVIPLAPLTPQAPAAAQAPPRAAGPPFQAGPAAEDPAVGTPGSGSADATTGRPQPGPAPAPAAASAPAPDRGPFVLASDLFTSTLASARPTEVRMGSDYLIGSGDHLVLTAFGSVTLAHTLKVDRGGKLAIPEVGLVQVAGLTLDAARTLIRTALRRRFSGLEQFNLEVAGIHDVEVLVIGEVRRPGSYLVPSASSPMALLGLAGGPAVNGSYRAVRHMRAGQTLQTLDLYRLRFDGAGLPCRGFRDGDILFVPLAGTRITAVGAFRRVAAVRGPVASRPDPAPEPEPVQTADQNAGPEGLLMELAPGETALDAVGFAGGLVASASQVLLTLQRTSPQGITTLQDLPNAPAALRAARLCEADVLRALERVERREDYVEAAGHVAVAGRFAFRDGMRVSDLLRLGGEGGQLLPGTYRLRGEILRTRADGATRLLSFDVDRALAGAQDQDLPLQPRDRVQLEDVAALRLPRRVTLLGPFTRPGVYDWHEGMRAADLIHRAGIPRLSAEGHYAELASLRDGGRSEVVRLDLARLLSTEERAPVDLADDRVNPLLRPYDQITVYENPAFRMHRTVTILGQVRRPGPYVVQADRFSLRQLIERAGGFTADAMPTGGIFLRSTLAPRDPSAPDAGGAGQAGPEALDALGPSGPPGPDSAGARNLAAVDGILGRLNESRRDRTSGALEASPLLHGLLLGSLNRMVVDFGAVLQGDPRRDVALQDGDQVFIPRRTDMVYVVGEVASAYSAFHVQPGDRVRDVLKLAGGYTRNADQRQARLLKADGRVIDSRVERTPIEPGDALLVPQRIRKDVPWQDTLLAMTPLAILYNAIRR